MNAISGTIPLALKLSPLGHLIYHDQDDSEQVSIPTANEILKNFQKGMGFGLLHLGVSRFENLPPSLEFWQEFSEIFIAEACKTYPEIDLPLEEIHPWLAKAPFMTGVEYLTLEVAQYQWQILRAALQEELEAFDGNLEAYFSTFHASWNTVGRVCFHLAENKNHPDKPFAFLASYTTRLAHAAQAKHLPLGRALEEYAGQKKKTQLLSLLLPVQKASVHSIFLKSLLDTSAIFKPLAWSAREAYQFLKDLPHFEAAGIMVRVPNWWNPKRPPRPTVNVSLGSQKASQLGLEALLDFDLACALPNGEKLSPKELKSLLESQNQLVQIKGQWVEVDQEKLTQVLDHWKMIESQVKKEGLSFSEGLRLLAGVHARKSSDTLEEDMLDWSRVIEGEWLKSTLEALRHPDQAEDTQLENILSTYLKADLRPYQKNGVKWLWWLYRLRLGACLADDMGLGKTIQVISLLLLIKYAAQKEVGIKLRTSPHLLILPASLLGNWQAEIQKFAPSLKVKFAHSSFEKNSLEGVPNLSDLDLVITTYGSFQKIPWIKEFPWHLVILDEAQAIKNSGTQQARAVKSLKSELRFILTGTPIENRLMDVWSLFDFIAPGLLGSSQSFKGYSKSSQFYGSIRRLVSPYILRRLKTDKGIIRDLPDKTEMQTYCTLTKPQAALYQQAVKELSEKLNEPMDGIKHKGLVLSYLMRLKQICNHPNQWLGHGQYAPEASGKFRRLRELCEIISEKQEKVLIFTQFKEIIPAIFEFLTDIFKKQGVWLDGQTGIKERAKRVEAFQEEQGPPFFVLSLKAGGVGLNLTRASHVIHFDRWWNPAVENQATDRAYRIGQKKNVLVHKFICKGTIEEKIDELIQAKKTLVNEIIGEGGELNLTELSNEELLNMVTLDIHRALGDNDS